MTLRVLRFNGKSGGVYSIAGKVCYLNGTEFCENGKGMVDAVSLRAPRLGGLPQGRLAAGRGHLQSRDSESRDRAGLRGRFSAFIIEVKRADAATDDLKALAREAREQIDGKKYDTAFRAEGIADIEKIGLAYFKNAVEISR